MKIFVSDMMKETIQFLQTKYKQSNKVFTAASPFGQLLIVLENLTQPIYYYIEDAITEQNIYEASRPSSVYSHSTRAGHNPSRSVGAVGEIQLRTLPAALNASANRVSIINYSKIVCNNNGLIYSLQLPQDDVKFSLKGVDDGLRMTIIQGQVESQTFTGTGRKTQSFQLGLGNNFYIDNYFVSVYVNGEKWTKYDAYLDMPRNAKAFYSRTGLTNGLDIFFGNGAFGKVPDLGSEIIVEYLINDGSAGSVPIEDSNQISYSFMDTAFTSTGEELNMNEFVEISSITPPCFGVDPESLELTRVIAAHASKNFALVNVDNYEILLKKMQLFSTVKVFLDPLDDRIIDILAVPDVTKFFKTSGDYFAISESKFMMSTFQKTQLVKYIEKNGTKLISTDIKLLDPVFSRYVANISLITYEGFDENSIVTEIHEKLGDYFIKIKRKDRVPKSDLIKIIEQIDGIDSVSITLISEKNEKARILNSRSAITGLDDFNDIVLNDEEFPLLRGGWKDRNGNVYASGVVENGLGAVNVMIKSRTKQITN